MFDFCVGYSKKGPRVTRLPYAGYSKTKKPRLQQGGPEESKKVFLNGSVAKRPLVPHVFNHGWWRGRLVAGAVGGW